MIIHQGEPLSFDLGLVAAALGEEQEELLGHDEVVVRQRGAPSPRFRR